MPNAKRTRTSWPTASSRTTSASRSRAATAGSRPTCAASPRGCRPRPMRVTACCSPSCPGLDFVRVFWACVLSGRVAVPVPAPDPVRLHHAAPRLRSLIADSRAALVLTSAALLDAAAATLDPATFAMARWMALPDPADAGQQPRDACLRAAGARTRQPRLPAIHLRLDLVAARRAADACQRDRQCPRGDRGESRQRRQPRALLAAALPRLRPGVRRAGARDRGRDQLPDVAGRFSAPAAALAGRHRGPPHHAQRRARVGLRRLPARARATRRSARASTAWCR